jgi:hypothetical protein
MARSIDDSGTGPADAEAGTRLSRRRPGRRDDVNPSLIPLLRGTASVDVDAESAIIADAPTEAERMEAEKDGLAPARGIMFGIALSIPIWTVLVLGAVNMFSGVAFDIALSIPVWVVLSLAACHLLD